MKRPGFMFYLEDFRPMKNRMTMEQRGMLLTAMCEFVEEETEPDIKDPYVALAFDYMRGRLQRDEEAYRQVVEKRRAAAKLGAEKRAAERRQLEDAAQTSDPVQESQAGEASVSTCGQMPAYAGTCRQNEPIATATASPAVTPEANPIPGATVTPTPTQPQLHARMAPSARARAGQEDGIPPARGSFAQVDRCMASGGPMTGQAKGMRMDPRLLAFEELKRACREGKVTEHGRSSVC